MNKNNGKHILAELWQCECDLQLLCNKEPLLTKLCEAVKAAGLTLVGENAHEFQTADKDDDANNDSENVQTSGVTISLLLAESHLCLHTWGELGTVTLDIYVCNFMHDNSDKATQLFEQCRQIFRPSDYRVRTIERNHAQENIGN